MPLYPHRIDFLDLPWFGYPASEKGGNRPAAVVHHIAEGSFETLCSRAFWQTRNGGRGGSVHFAVAKDGRVAQLVDTADAAYGNGIVNLPTWPGVALGNPNEFTVSIEHEGFTGDPWPAAMREASLELTAWILETHGLEPGPDTVIGHYRIDAINRPNCPGSGWPIDYLLEGLRLMYNPTPEERSAIAWFTANRGKISRAIEFLEANQGALAPYALAARKAKFTQAFDGESLDDGVSRGITREIRRLRHAQRPWPESAGQALPANIDAADVAPEDDPSAVV